MSRRILVSGSTGLIGSALVLRLAEAGHTVDRLVRTHGEAQQDEILWQPDQKVIDRGSLEGFDAVVHLAGENLGTSRWTREKKEKIRASRVAGTRLLAEALAACERPPVVLACASAIGFYGSRGDDVLSEKSEQGSGFLAGVCREWEAACSAASDRGIRVVNLRFGVVLAPHGGALAAMLPLFRKGGGGRLGNGRQWWSWISCADAVGAIEHALGTDSITGPVNVVSPRPVTNREFTKTLGHVLGRPTVLPTPAFALRLLLGEMADELLLASCRVEPARLLATGYAFRHPDLEATLHDLLGEP